MPAVLIVLVGLFGLCGCTKDDVVLRKVGTARLRAPGADIAYGVWENDGCKDELHAMPLVLVMEGGSWSSTYSALAKCILVEEDRFYVGKELTFTEVSAGCRTVRPFVNDAVPIDRGNFDVNRLLVVERDGRRYYLGYGKSGDGVLRESVCLMIPKREGWPAGQDETDKSGRMHERVNVLSGANVHDRIATNFLDDVKLDKPFLFFPRMTYYDDKGAGEIAGRMCRVKMACPSQAYAMEQVLAPVTNAIAVGYGMEMESASGILGADGGDLAFFALSGKIGARIDVKMRPYKGTRDDLRNYFLFELNIHERDLIGANDLVRLEGSQYFRSMQMRDLVWKSARIALRKQMMRMPTVIDDWHKLSADEIERTRNFSRRSPCASSHVEAMETWCSNRLGVVLGVNARRIPWLKVEDEVTYPRKFRSLRPIVDVSTNGWSITEIHANRQSATIFGVRAARIFPSREVASADCIEILHEIENMLLSCFTKSGNPKDAAPADEEVKLLNPSFNIVVTLPHEVETNRWEYSVDLVARRLQNWRHMTTTAGCFEEPE